MHLGPFRSFRILSHLKIHPQSPFCHLKSRLLGPGIRTWMSLGKRCAAYHIVLVYSGGYNKNTADRVAETTNIYFSQLWRLEAQDQGGLRVWVRVCILIHKWLSPRVLTRRRGHGGLSGVSFIRELILFTRVSHNLIISKAPTF